MSNEAEIRGLVAEIKTKYPSLSAGIDQMVTVLFQLYYESHPIVGITRRPGGISSTLGDIAVLNIAPFLNTLRLSWDLVDNAARYEIRLGSDWDSGTSLLKTSSNVANFDPIADNFVYGTYTFWIKAVGFDGLYSKNAISATLTVGEIAAPALTGSSIANNALLFWSDPASTWMINYYNIYRDGVVVGNVVGNFTSYQELAAGTHSYKVTAVDIVDNESTPSPEVTLMLLDPIDYLLNSDVDAALTGTYSNTRLVDGQYVLGPVFIRTWEHHFSDNGASSFQDLIDAGYPLYFQPTEASGYYQEIFDFGSIVANATVVTVFNKTQLEGTTIISNEIEGSTDGIVWTAPVASSSAFFSSVRYARIKYIFTNGDDLSAAWIYSIRALLNIQLTLDSGSVAALAADVGGTTVTFNKTFSQVNSVTLAVDDPNTRIAVYQSVTTTTFKVFVFDAAGVRKDATVSWKARGVI
jgi:hypothetical protein